MKDKQDELFVVVDRKDRIVGFRTRFDCHHNKKLIHRAIGIVIFNSKGEILLQKRSKYKDLHPGYYTVSASGHVGKGETYLQAAKRELLEELGVRIPLKKGGKHIAKIKEETEMDCFFTAQYDGPFYPSKDEVEKVEFVKISQLKSLIPKLTPMAILRFQQLKLL